MLLLQRTLQAVLCLFVFGIPLVKSNFHLLKVQPQKSITLESCDIDSLITISQTPVVCDDDFTVRADIYHKHGSVCNVTEVYGQDVSVARYVCINGEWHDTISTGTDVTVHHRQKRWGWFVAAVVVCLIFCGSGGGGGGGGGGTQIVHKYPPEFESNCPPGDLVDTYYTPAGSTEVTVFWAEPSASDRDGSIESLMQTIGISRGGSFSGTPSGQQHSIAYKATDNEGQSTSCYFSFIVKVKTCPTLQWPVNGYRECPDDNILGGTCTYSCHEGYQLEGNSEVTCQLNNGNPTWTARPRCEKISCGSPPTVANGDVSCIDPNYAYNSYCSYTCDAGYGLEGQVLTVCRADRSWLIAIAPSCKDDEPPSIACLTPQVFYADRASTSTSVTWIEPDVSDLNDPNPILNLISPPGFELGTVIESGTSEYVTYQASDAEGNLSPFCSIELRVLEISCGHPLDTLEDADLRFNCSMSTYSYGDTCSLFCALNFPLEGAAVITCETTSGDGEGYWDWGSGDMPYCSDVACPDITPPLNGALVYDTINGRPIATMLCNEQFDIPEVSSSFNGLFLCQDSGMWNPPVTQAPDCTEIFSTRGFRLPAEIFYYSGTCGIDDNINEQFENIVNRLHLIASYLCETDSVCTINQPRIVCGVTGKRRKRALHYRYRRNGDQDVSVEGDEPDILFREKRQADIMRISFNIQVDFNISGMSLSQIYNKTDHIQLNLIKPAIQTLLDNGTLDINSWTTNNDSFRTDEYGVVYCDPGFVVDAQTKCKACPRGYYEINDCVICPIGEYSNTSGSTNCTACQDGFSTRETGSVSASNCTELCHPGHYSPDTFVPCAPCKLGFYQSQSGQRTCTPCPGSQTTMITGRTSESDCKYFDIIVNQTQGLQNVANITELGNLSVSFWTKTLDIGAPNTSINIGNVIEVSLQDSISFITTPYGNNAVQSVAGSTSRLTWIHIAAIWDTLNNQLSVYYKGVLVNQVQATPPSSTLVQNGQLSIRSNGAPVAISGFRVIDGLLDPTTMTSSCHLSNNYDTLHMGHLRSGNMRGISVTTPSTCDAVDECLENPCNGHNCTNGINGFTCICSNGWNGTTCDIPPDHCIDNECENGATCLNRETDYECQCPLGYSGVICDIPPVDGEWSSWTRWTGCTVTCNRGFRSRTRACDSPPPGEHGQNCPGEDLQIQPCNTEPCPICSDLSRGYGNVKACEILESGMELCNFTCLPGLVLPKGLGEFLSYKCGPETDYEWHPRDNVPGCKDPDRPDRLTLTASGTYGSIVSAENRQSVITGVGSNTNGAACFNNPSCQRNVRLGNEGSYRKRRNTGTTVTVTFTIDINGTTDLQLDAFETNNTVSEGLQEIIDAITSLEATAQAINSSASSVFDVTVNGTTYEIDPSTLMFDGTAACGEGQVATEGLCTACPTGTYKNGDLCAYCEKGTYQNVSGQQTCHTCPSGFTTVTLGSTSSQQCSVVDNTTTTTPTTSTTTSTTTPTSTSTTSSTTTTSTTTPTTTSSTTTSTTTPTTTSTTTTSTTKQTTTSSTTTSTTKPTTSSSTTTSTTKPTTTSSTTTSTTKPTTTSSTTTSKTTPTTTLSTTTFSTTPTTTSTITSSTSTTASTTTPGEQKTNGLLIVIIASIGSFLTLIVLIIIVVVLLKRFCRSSKCRNNRVDEQEHIYHTPMAMPSDYSTLGPLSSTKKPIWQSSRKEGSIVESLQRTKNYMNEYGETELTSDYYMEPNRSRVPYENHLYLDDYDYIR